MSALPAIPAAPARPRSTRLRLLVLLVLGLLVVPQSLPAAAAPRAADTAPAANAGATGTIHAKLTVKRRTARQVRVAKTRRAMRIAMRQRGDWYAYGAAGPNRFDCSGLVYFSTRRAGLKGVPRTSSAQSGYMRRISRDRMRRGDFVFFTGGGGVYHVGFYAGRRDGRRVVLHSPYSGRRVSIDPIWTDSWFAGTLRPR